MNLGRYLGVIGVTHRLANLAHPSPFEGEAPNVDHRLVADVDRPKPQLAIRRNVVLSHPEHANAPAVPVAPTT